VRINDDLHARVHVASHKLDWVASPLPGVDRRMLDRIGGEVARATTIVRYAPGSFFSAHSHDGGEEFLVLDGVFSDEHGDYGPGHYVRNPRGSSHTPFSKDGCTIFVKLWQMEEDDQDFIRTDTRGTTYRPGSTKGITLLDLHRYGNEMVRMEKWRPGTSESRIYEGGAEYLVIDGLLEDKNGRYAKGDWLRLPPGYDHILQARERTQLYVKTGHLSKPPNLFLFTD